MDPVTHALIGMAVSTVSQGRFVLTNPVTAAAALGAVIPDGDIVLKIWGDSLYLKHHRGVSHSLLFMPIEAAAAAGVLKIVFIGTPFIMLFFWAFMGALSHVLFDLLNSYGARVFWPFIKRKNSLSLIAITDPFVLLFSVLSIMYSYRGSQYDLHILIMFLIYILGKVLFRFYGHAMVKKKFGDGYDVERIHILPSMIAIHKLHYIIETPKCKIVGEFNFLHKSISVIDCFCRVDACIREQVLKSKAAVYFKEFTPIFHVGFEKYGAGYRALLTDLRYMFNKKYLHHATIILDENMSVVEERFNPYSMSNSLDV